MKIQLKYATPFTVPTVLPHAPFEGDESQDICCDEYEITPCFPDAFAEGKATVALVKIFSKCGTTTLDCVARKTGEGVTVCGRGSDEEGPEAVFEGAENALNAVWGIEFPEFTVIGEIESSYGRFPSISAYQTAKRAVKAAQRGTLTAEDLDSVLDRHGNRLTLAA